MGNKRDKHATAADIQAAIRQQRLQAMANSALWACVLDVVHKQQGQQVTKRFQTALKERLSAAFPNHGYGAGPDTGMFVVTYENGSFGARVSIWHNNVSHAETHGLPGYANSFTVKIGDKGQWAGTRWQDTIDLDYIKENNRWHGAEDEKALKCQQALQRGKPQEWADKIKAIDEAKKALLADAQAFGISYLLDV